MAKKLQDWRPAFDMPHTKAQALSVLKEWSSPLTATFSSERCKRVLECLTVDSPHPIPAQIAMGHHLGGWAYGTKDGWFGPFDTHEAAKQAGFEAMVAGTNATPT